MDSILAERFFPLITMYSEMGDTSGLVDSSNAGRSARWMCKGDIHHDCVFTQCTLYWKTSIRRRRWSVRGGCIFSAGLNQTANNAYCTAFQLYGEGFCGQIVNYRFSKRNRSMFSCFQWTFQCAIFSVCGPHNRFVRCPMTTRCHAGVSTDVHRDQ